MKNDHRKALRRSHRWWPLQRIWGGFCQTNYFLLSVTSAMIPQSLWFEKTKQRCGFSSPCPSTFNSIMISDSNLSGGYFRRKQSRIVCFPSQKPHGTLLHPNFIYKDGGISQINHSNRHPWLKKISIFIGGKSPQYPTHFICCISINHLWTDIVPKWFYCSWISRQEQHLIPHILRRENQHRSLGLNYPLVCLLARLWNECVNKSIQRVILAA